MQELVDMYIYILHRQLWPYYKNQVNVSER